MMSEENKDAVLDGVVRRVKKMLTLAADAGAAEGERDNAIRMAHALLAKHNMTVAQVEAANADSKKEERTGGISVTRDQPWARQTASAIARLFFCKHFFMK